MLRVLLAAILLSFAACAHADGGGAQAPGLDIVLTNDDGYDAPGLLVLRAALQAAGHEVSVVAPGANRSGSSVAITSHGTLTWHEPEPGVIAVDGTPADCMRVAMTTLRATPPDLIISGINFGQNVGPGMLSSGTVGAALAGASHGIPSIAISQTVDPHDVSGTARYFPSAAEFVVRLVAALQADGTFLLLPAGVTLNVNYPARVSADVLGVRFTRQGRSTLYSLVYTRQGDSAVSMAFAPNKAAETVADADTTALREGYVSVTPLDGDWTTASNSQIDPERERALESLRRLTRSLDLTPPKRAVGARR